MGANGDADLLLAPWNGPGWSSEDGFNYGGEQGASSSTANNVLAPKSQNSANPLISESSRDSEEASHATVVGCCLQADSEKMVNMKRLGPSPRDPSPILMHLPVIVKEPEEVFSAVSNTSRVHGEKSTLEASATQKIKSEAPKKGAIAGTMPTFEVNFLIVPRREFSKAWLEEANKQWQKTARQQPRAIFSV
mmetsp:Transcript_33837/g.60210  ORF Transcript_33837/g.60210 Transcript_33837/m.60210 type:complete len:192 (-) Transcript_33837:75-650(-)